MILAELVDLGAGIVLISSVALEFWLMDMETLHTLGIRKTISTWHDMV